MRLAGFDSRIRGATFAARPSAGQEAVALFWVGGQVDTSDPGEGQRAAEHGLVSGGLGAVQGEFGLVTHAP